MEELHEFTEKIPLNKLSDSLHPHNSNERIIGAFIEGDLGTQFVVDGGIFCQTVTTLDVPVKPMATMSAVRAGKELKNLEEITQEHLSFGQKGTLKESVVKGYPHDDFFATQIYVNLYFLTQFLSSSCDKLVTWMHVHVHRGGSMGPTHINLLRQKFLPIAMEYLTSQYADINFSQILTKSTPNVLWWIFENPSTQRKVFMTIGYGYKHDELSPPSLPLSLPQSLPQEDERFSSLIESRTPRWWLVNNNSEYGLKAVGRGKPGWKLVDPRIVDFYYSISLIVGFDPQMSSGQTNIPRNLMKFDTLSTPATLHLSQTHKIPNELISQWEKIREWVADKVQLNVINGGTVLHLTGGIYNPDPEVEVLVNYGWHSQGSQVWPNKTTI